MAEKARGRPRAYDAERATWQALEAFWAGGYTGTSLDDLAAATGMNRPSLYAAFGDKKALYLTTLARFEDELRREMGGELFKQEAIADALKAFYAAALEFYFSGTEGARGCFVVCTAPAEAARDADIRMALHRILKGIDDGLEARFKKAMKDGELPASSDANALAKLAAASLHSIAIRARAGEAKKSLQTMAFQTIGLLCARAPQGPANGPRIRTASQAGRP